MRVNFYIESLFLRSPGAHWLDLAVCFWRPTNQCSLHFRCGWKIESHVPANDCVCQKYKSDPGLDFEASAFLAAPETLTPWALADSKQIPADSRWQILPCDFHSSQAVPSMSSLGASSFFASSTRAAQEGFLVCGNLNLPRGRQYGTPILADRTTQL